MQGTPTGTPMSRERYTSNEQGNPYDQLTLDLQQAGHTYEQSAMNLPGAGPPPYRKDIPQAGLYSVKENNYLS